MEFSTCRIPNTFAKRMSLALKDRSRPKVQAKVFLSQSKVFRPQENFQDSLCYPLTPQNWLADLKFEGFKEISSHNNCTFVRYVRGINCKKNVYFFARKFDVGQMDGDFFWVQSNPMPFSSDFLPGWCPFEVGLQYFGISPFQLPVGFKENLPLKNTLYFGPSLNGDGEAGLPWIDFDCFSKMKKLPK